MKSTNSSLSSVFCFVVVLAAIPFLAACQRDTMGQIVDVPDSSDSASVFVTIDPETRVTVDELGGAIRFSPGDLIKIYDGNTVYTGVTYSSSNSGTFSMSEGFNGSGSGFAALPASMVSFSFAGVTFTLPDTYDFSVVGGTDANSALVPCPMMGSYSGNGGISLKPVCSLIRFYLTNVAAGSLIFTFPTNVTGATSTAIASTPSGTDDGIRATNLTNAGKTITVAGVPDVALGRTVCITLPVPTGTVPGNILVVNEPDDASDTRIAGLPYSSKTLVRAGGHKLTDVSLVVPPASKFNVSSSASVAFAPGNLMAHIRNITDPVAIADKWKFGSPFEYVGVAANGGNSLFYSNSREAVGKWVDLFIWQGASCSVKGQGLVRLNTNNESYTGNTADESLYEGCWKTHNYNEYPASGDYIHISNGGTYDWRPIQYGEWEFILTDSSRGALVGGTSNARFARVTIAGVNGLLIFPDSSTQIWNTATMGSVPSGINTTDYQSWGTNSYSASNGVAIISAGISFLPSAGQRYSNHLYAGSQGDYWTSSGNDNKTYAICGYIDEDDVEPGQTVRTRRRDSGTVRLVRDI